MGPVDDDSGVVLGRAVGPMADAVAVIRRPAGVGAGPGPGGGTPIAGLVAVISATVIPSAAGGEVHALELVDRLVMSLTDTAPVAVLPTDLLVRTGPGEFVLVCPAPAGQCRIMAVVDAIRRTILEHVDPELPVPGGLSISVAFAGSGAAP